LFFADKKEVVAKLKEGRKKARELLRQI